MNIKADQSYPNRVCVRAHREDWPQNQAPSPSCSSSFPFISSQYLTKLKIPVPLIRRTPKGWKGSMKLLGNPHWWPTLRTQQEETHAHTRRVQLIQRRRVGVGEVIPWKPGHASRHGESKAGFRNAFRKNHQQTPPHEGPAMQLSPTVTSV